MKHNVVRLCCDYIIFTGIDTLPVRFSDLIRLCNDLGYSVCAYSKIQALYSDFPGVLEHFGRVKGFTFCSAEHNKHVIFYDDRLSTSERLFVLAHEIGHVVLKHNRVFMDFSDPVDPEQEAEADAFAYQLLAPLCILRRCDIKTVRKISLETLLDEERAAHVCKLMSDETPQFREDELFNQFNLYIMEHTKTENTRPTDRMRDSLFFIPMICMVFMLGVALARWGGSRPVYIPILESRIVTSIEPAPDAESIETESLPDTVSATEQSGGYDGPNVALDTSAVASSRRASQTSAAPSADDTPVPYTVDVPSSQPQTWSQVVPPSSQELVLVPIIPKVLSDGNTYYWSAGGEVYHLSPDCPHLKNAAQIVSGELGEAQRNGRKRLCLDCEKKYKETEE